MSKNVTGGIILLLAGSVAIAFAATDKGREIIGVLTSSGSPASGAQTGSGAGAPASGSSAGSGSGFGGFGGSTSSGSGSGTIAVADYKKILTPGAFVGEKAAIVI